MSEVRVLHQNNNGTVSKDLTHFKDRVNCIQVLITHFAENRFLMFVINISLGTVVGHFAFCSAA